MEMTLLQQLTDADHELEKDAIAIYQVAMIFIAINGIG